MRRLTSVVSLLAATAVFGGSIIAAAPAAVAAEVNDPGQVSSGAVTLRSGDTGDVVKLLQQRLYNSSVQVAETGVYDGQTTAAVKHFQWKFGLSQTGTVNQRTWREISRLGTTDRVPAICKRKARAICGSKLQKTLRYYEKGKLVYMDDARYSVPASLTRVGNFKVYTKDWDVVSTEYRTWMPRAMFFSGGEAMHFSPFFKRDGYSGGSHGCIGFKSLPIATKWYKRVKIGTFVKIYKR